jgi:hypothetical protein
MIFSISVEKALMETTQIVLDPVEMLQIMGIILLGYVILMGTVFILFKAMFASFNVKEVSTAKKRTAAIKNHYNSQVPLRIRKMRLSQ